jgi:hypothetical protein
MDVWLHQQVGNVLTALSHAQQLYGEATASEPPRPFALRPDLEHNLGGGLV